MGSKNRWMYNTKAINVPRARSFPAIMRAPKNRAKPMATAVRISTAGNRPEDSLLAHRLASRWSTFFSSNNIRLRSCRFMDCTTLTPVIFSFREPFTMDMARRTVMNAFRANGCQTTIINVSTGRTLIVINPSLKLSRSNAMTIPSRLNNSPKVITTSAANSCSWETSP